MSAKRQGRPWKAVNKMNKACVATTSENIICEDLTAIKNIKDGDDNGTRQTLSRFRG